MVASLDIGNTNFHFGLYRGEKLIKKVVYSVTEKVLEKKILKILKNKKVDGVAIASVVPPLTLEFSKFFKREFNISALIVSSDLNCHLRFDYYKPETLGADRIANVVGGLARYKKDLIIIDFGTAITLDVVSENGFYLGGIIAPGIRTQMDALIKGTALLENISLEKPKHLIGRSTEECMQSGIFNGTGMMIRGFIQSIGKKYKKKFVCVAVGGWGKVMYQQLDGEIKHYDPDLCLFGALKIYYYNA